METQIENIIVVSNLLELTKAIFKKIGNEYQAPLEDDIINELVAGQVMNKINSVNGDTE